MKRGIFRSRLIITIGLTFASAAFTAVAAQDIPKCGEGNGLRSSEMKDIVKLHNSARDGVGAGKLNWDCGLAAKAQAAADAAIAGANATSAPGENRISSYDGSLDVKDAVDLWRQERRDWNDKTGACEAGHSCNHWEQMSYAHATKVGCGINRKGKGNTKAVLVCTYDPAKP